MKNLLQMLTVGLLVLLPGCSRERTTCGGGLPSTITFEKTFGGTAADIGMSVVQIDDGGYVVAGTRLFIDAREFDVYLIKTDAAGDTLWTRTFGGDGAHDGSSVIQTSDGGYFVVGFAGSADVYLIKTDASGDTLWTRSYGGTEIDGGISVVQVSDGGYAIAGHTESFGSGEADVYLIKTDAAGDTLWTRTFGGTGQDRGTSVVQTNDGGYVVAGLTWSFGAGGSDVYLIKTDATGDTLWSRTYGGAASDYGYSVVQTNDGGYVVAGFTSSSGAGSVDVYLVKTDASGDTLWTRTLGGTGWDYGYSVVQTNDGGYVVAGETTSFGAGGADVYLIKTDASGGTLWTRTFGGTGWDRGTSVAQTNDGGCVVTGTTDSFGAGGSDVYLIKLDANGNL